MNTFNIASERAKKLQPSMTLEITALAQELKKKGKDICSLSQGEPDFDTPGFITEAAIKALKDGVTRYGPAAGDPELREVIAKKITEINKIPTNIENVLVTNGGKQAIFNLFLTLLNPGDEVIIPSPYWLSYPEMVKLADAIPIYTNTKATNGFKIDLEDLESKITEKTKLIIINSPGNPTGRVIRKDELEKVAEILRKHPNILVLSDEIYEHLISNNVLHYSLASIAPDLRERVFIVNGFAKAWAMTGWRVGYLAGDSNIIKKSIALQSQSTSNVCSFAQKGAIAAITSSKDHIQFMIDSYNKRRVILNDGIQKMDGLTVILQEGAFYSFPKLHERFPESLEFCKIALEKVGLAVVPGIAFGNDKCIRLSCAVSDNVIKEGLYRLDKLLNYLG